MFKRKEYQIIKYRIENEPRKFIQVIIGPRQIGKTTLAKQLVGSTKIPTHYISADGMANPGSAWIQQNWETARINMKQKDSNDFVLVFDEIQKVPDWSEYVKAEWDKDTFNDLNLKVILLGSASLLIQKGLSESLMGRFETIYMTHWSLDEMQEAFEYSEDQFVWFGGYPGAAEVIGDEERWKHYILNSLIEPSILKDILMLTRIDKPALLRRVFELSCSYSGKILSYTKMLGQLQDAGNTTTLAHYLDLLDSAGLVTGLEKYYKEKVRQRGSIPKFQVYNNALLSVQSAQTIEQVKGDPAKWGHIIESSIGAHLINKSRVSDIKVYYWRQSSFEIDFVLEKGDTIIGVEVKSGPAKIVAGRDVFQKHCNPSKIILVSESGIPWKDFLKIDPSELF